MKLLSLILILILALGCNRPPVKRQQQNAAFSVYVQEFEKLSGRPVLIAMNFGDVQEDGKSAICYSYGPNNIYNYIIFNESDWDVYGHFGREQLVFHELAHCILGRKHLNAKNSQGEPLSIMYWQVFGDSGYYERNRNYYINELFGGY